MATGIRENPLCPTSSRVGLPLPIGREAQAWGRGVSGLAPMCACARV